MSKVQSLEDVIKDAHQWQLVTFPNATPVSKLKHLQDEVKELIEVLTEEQYLASGDSRSETIFHDVNSEFADCFLLLFGAAYKYGFSIGDIVQIIEQKMKINKERKWGKANDDGVVYHEK